MRHGHRHGQFHLCGHGPATCNDLIFQLLSQKSGAHNREAGPSLEAGQCSHSVVAWRLDHYEPAGTTKQSDFKRTAPGRGLNIQCLYSWGSAHWWKRTPESWSKSETATTSESAAEPRQCRGDALFSERRFVMTWLRLETLAASRLIAMLCAGLAGCWSATDKTSQRARSPRKTRRRTDGVRLSAGGGLRLP